MYFFLLFIYKQHNKANEYLQIKKGILSGQLTAIYESHSWGWHLTCQ